MNHAHYCLNEPAIISEDVDGETIVLNFETGHYYSFNRSASELWRRLCAGHPLDAAAAVVAQRYAVDPLAIAPSIAAFVERLVDEQLIRPAPGPGPALAPETPGTPAQDFEPPAFEKYTDMEDMLLLDPIHEVSDKGWPRKAG